MKCLRYGIVAVSVLPMMMGGLPCAAAEGADSQEVNIVLSDEKITVDGEETALLPENTDTSGLSVYLANDVLYYEDRDSYDSGNPYGEGTEEDRHTAEEAGETTVVHIAEPGTYRISGTLSQGQIAVDLGEDAKTDPEAVVNLILDGAEVSNKFYMTDKVNAFSGVTDVKEQ